MTERCPILAFTLMALTAHASTAAAQGTAADYARSEGLRSRMEGLVVGAPTSARWIDSTNTFWYRRSTKTGTDVVQVNAKTLDKRLAFDAQRLATSLSASVKRPFTPTTLPALAVVLAYLRTAAAGD